jgi:hypothetical protein
MLLSPKRGKKNEKNKSMKMKEMASLKKMLVIPRSKKMGNKINFDKQQTNLGREESLFTMMFQITFSNFRGSTI